MGVKRWAVAIGAADRAQLEAWLRTQSTPQALAMRARVVPGGAAGESIRALAQRPQLTERTIRLWRRRYAS
jgi:hypothetical protein